jgi:hypothetical protein
MAIDAGAPTLLLDQARMKDRDPAGPCHSGLRLILQPISNPAVNDLLLVANRPEIEKVRPFRL